MGNMLNYFKNRIKNITLLRGIYFIWRNYLFNYRRHLAYCPDTVVITPPYISEIQQMYSFMIRFH